MTEIPEPPVLVAQITKKLHDLLAVTEGSIIVTADKLEGPIWIELEPDLIPNAEAICQQMAEALGHGATAYHTTISIPSSKDAMGMNTLLRDMESLIPMPCLDMLNSALSNPETSTYIRRIGESNRGQDPSPSR